MNVSKVRVLGIDPGSRKAGWGLIDVDRAKRTLTHVDNGVLMLDVHGALADRVVELSQKLHQIIEKHRPSVAAVEDVFVRKGARSALVLGQARGAMLATLGLCAVPVTSHTTTRVKARVTGRGRASKEQVAQMVSVVLGLKSHPFEDAADALAVAICQAYDDMAPPTATSLPPPRRRGSNGRAALADLARAQGKIP